MSELAIYLNDFVDETMPCEATLEGWAAWLSKPDADWGRPEPANDGDTFATKLTDIVEVVASIDSEGNLSCKPSLPTKYDEMVPRYGSGQGWDACDFCLTENDLMEQLEFHGHAFYVAVLTDRPGAYHVVYHAGVAGKPAWCELKEGGR